MTVKVLGEVEKVLNIICSFYLVSWREWLFVKKCANSVIRGKDCTFLSDRVV